MKSFLILIIAIALTMGLCGCSTPVTHTVDNQHDSVQLDYIRDGVTTREEILSRFGNPASVYEEGRIITYWLLKNNNDELEVTTMNVTAISVQSWSWQDYIDSRAPSGGIKSGYYNLVLVFSENDTVEKHSIVFIR